ncbi:hypothetical protein N658DRAFT_345764 [Parathielavia hyrcaniae]|uniref:Uncharacterized protein n=1 Tax=Parathielavia hyrcaniae TaxID=113614 RepID=A0AAN6PU27_9PEZI|nr:hypothetical protein N658DRAFT_345764 [Parathielavia hyrcaniae]
MHNHLVAQATAVRSFLSFLTIFVFISFRITTFLTLLLYLATIFETDCNLASPAHPDMALDDGRVVWRPRGEVGHGLCWLCSGRGRGSSAVHGFDAVRHDKDSPSRSFQRDLGDAKSTEGVQPSLSFMVALSLLPDCINKL